MGDLEDVFDDEKESVEEPEKEPVPEPEAEPEGDAEVESEMGEKKEAEIEASESGPPSDKKPSDTVPMAALIAERQKRQQAEARLRKQEEKPLPDPIEDPEGYAKTLQGRNDAAIASMRIEISRDSMLSAHEDYEEKEAVFVSMVQDEDGNIKDASLHKEFLKATNPARFAYEKASKYLEVERLKDPAYIDKLVEERTAQRLEELEASLRAELGLGKKPKAPAPDLISATAAGKNTVEKIADGGLDEVMADSVF